MDFVCPGLLSDYKKFQKHYERKIYEGRAKNATSKQVAEGRQRGEEVGLGLPTMPQAFGSDFAARRAFPEVHPEADGSCFEQLSPAQM